MRAGLIAILLGTLLFGLNHAGVIAGMLDPPAGYQPAYFLRNMDVPEYLTWVALAKDHWLLPNFHAPWQTEPALFQPMAQVVAWIGGRMGLPTPVAYYGLQILLYWIAAYALIFAASTFLRTRRDMLYAGLAVLCTVPLKVFPWAVAKLSSWLLGQAIFAYGIVEYAYDSADGLMRGGLSNTLTLSFGTAITLFAFSSLARFYADQQRRHYVWLLVCVFLDGFFHPFEIFLITVAAVWPLLRIGRRRECLLLFCTAGLGMLPYVIQAARSDWVRDASDLAQWKMGSPAWVFFVYGLPAMMVVWLMLLRVRVERPEDEVLQSWFLCAALLPMIPAIPGSMHIFDGFAYCVGFLLVRKARQDKLFSRLFAEKPRGMRMAVAGWALVSVLALGVVYRQVWKDGKSAHPEMLLSAVTSKEESGMLAWMKVNLPRDSLALAPEDMAPWVATIPMPSVASHDLFSITYAAQHSLAERFYKGEDVRGELLDGFGVSYVIAPKSAPIQLAGASLLHEEGSLRLFELPGQRMKAYPGAVQMAGGAPKNAVRQWFLHLFAFARPSRAKSRDSTPFFAGP